MNGRRETLVALGALAIAPASLRAQPELAPKPALMANQTTAPILSGQAALRILGLRIYDARLWVSAGSSRDIFEREFFLELRYAVSAKGARIASVSAEEMAAIGQANEAQRRAWGEAMRGLFPDVGAGDRLLGAYAPRGATRFFYNDEPLGRIDDPDFGRAFFGIWLDPRTSEPSLREGLLRGFNR
jgi:hypothetical protein